MAISTSGSNHGLGGLPSIVSPADRVGEVLKRRFSVLGDDERAEYLVPNLLWYLQSWPKCVFIPNFNTKPGPSTVEKDASV